MTAVQEKAVNSTAAQEVRRLRATFATGRTRSVQWRLDQLKAIETMLTDGEPAIAAALASDLGRPANDTFLGDIAPPLAEAKFARKHLRQWMKPQRVGVPLSQFPGRAWYDYEPLGVVLVIGPWNYPVYLTIGPLVAAIAAGNCAVLKPSEHAPATAAVLADLVTRYLDTDAITVLEGGAEVTQDILAQGLDHAFFTGGPEVGKAVMAAAAPHLTPVTLELGGKCPVFVAADADLDVAARRIAWTKLLNSGQTCIAPDYLLVDASVREAFLPKLADAFRDLSPNRDGGRQLPIVSSRHAQRLADLLDNHGGEVLLGGGAEPDQRKVDLTVVVDPNLDAKVMQEEIFGPILPVVTVESVDAALAHITSGPKPLAAYIFSGSKALQRRFRKTVSAGAVVANHVAMHVLVPELPFGGVGNSGMGAYHGKWGFETFSHRKAHLNRAVRPDPRLLYPPYNAITQRILRFVF
ncbi:aldehyde dehydrogenase family protein [Skermania sp. ID1734]|uniref:aldehyde dehydrogenase family protein n=1 Tax=Skermania sp. ID1734 TaxID=2597516 RepID=UPI00117D1411|nr:aldehyde dehydrogenase family protein [Skermania sp. ID1734]TSE01137.1 aldehyde dehydrogenase family protein [Skermania sp. ID1734]